MEEQLVLQACYPDAAAKFPGRIVEHFAFAQAFEDWPFEIVLVERPVPPEDVAQARLFAGSREHPRMRRGGDSHEVVIGRLQKAQQIEKRFVRAHHNSRRYRSK